MNTQLKITEAARQEMKRQAFLSWLKNKHPVSTKVITDNKLNLMDFYADEWEAWQAAQDQYLFDKYVQQSTTIGCAVITLTPQTDAADVVINGQAHGIGDVFLGDHDECFQENEHLTAQGITTLILGDQTLSALFHKDKLEF